MARTKKKAKKKAPLKPRDGTVAAIPCDQARQLVSCQHRAFLFQALAYIRLLAWLALPARDGANPKMSSHVVMFTPSQLAAIVRFSGWTGKTTKFRSDKRHAVTYYFENKEHNTAWQEKFVQLFGSTALTRFHGPPKPASSLQPSATVYPTENVAFKMTISHARRSLSTTRKRFAAGARSAL